MTDGTATAETKVSATERTATKGLLVLSRRPDEDIVINHDIIVRVIEIRGDKVRLGIRAPKDCPVHRSEIYHVLYPFAGDEAKVAAAKARCEADAPCRSHR